jgi:hypothetical protein
VTFYLSSPSNQMTADKLRGMPVLVSYALYAKWMDQYLPSFDRVLIDSGAFSEFNSGKAVDGSAYRDWCARWEGVEHVAAVAGLDDIRGDWRKSLKNYELFGGFPTFHETDPPELLDDLLPIARDRGGWLGVGLLPPRGGKWRWVKETLSRIPEGLHVHFWAGGEYCGHPRVDSCDSTNWLLDSFQYRKDLPFLTLAECVELVVKRYQRARRKPVNPAVTPSLFSLREECDVGSNAQDR